MSKYLKEREIMKAYMKQHGTSHTKSGPGRWHKDGKKKSVKR